jgi:hypothetical protein
MNFKTFLVLTLLFLSKLSQSQTFEIIERNNFTDDIIIKHTNSLSSADMEKYRGKTISKVFEFQNGIKFKLISARDLFISGQNIDPNNYSDTRPYNYKEPTFLLTDSGFLIALYKKLEK